MMNFDDWYKSKHGGFSFDSHYLLPTVTVQSVITALTRETREYVSEMVERLARDIKK